MPQKEIIRTDKAPKAIGPYSVANRVGNLVYTAGQTGLDPLTNELVPGGIQAETRQVLTNIKNVLEAAGSSFWSKARIAQASRTKTLLILNL